MGGCSSKPKTAEFEGCMDLQDDKPQDEAPRKSLEAEKNDVHAGLNGIDTEQTSELSMQILVTESDLRDRFAERKQQDFSSEDNLKEERQVLEDDRQHVKQMLAEAINDSGAEKVLTVKEDTLKISINPEVLESKFHEKIPLLISMEAETVDVYQEPLTLFKETLENGGKYFFSESKTTGEDSSKLQVKPMGPQDGQLELAKILSAGGEEISEVQKETFFSEDVDLGLQKDGPTEARRKGRMESECNEAVSENEERELDEIVGHQRQEKQFGEGSKGCEELSKEPNAGAWEMVNTANGGVLAMDRGDEVLKDSSKPIWEDQIKCTTFGDATEGFIIGTCIANNSPFAETSGQDPFREMDCTDAVHPAITPDVNLINLQHILDEQDLVQEEQEGDVDAAYKVAMKDVIPQAGIHPMNGFLMKKSNVEKFDTTDGEGKLISPNISMDDKYLLPLAVDSDESHVQYLLENSLGEVQEEKLYAAVICIAGQQKSDASCTADEVTASQVIATTKKPEAQSVHVMEFGELVAIPAQDIPAPDIDEVLEKLASEFERQESLARATS